MSAMLLYHFALHDRGNRIDDFGGLPMADDGEALDFGNRVIRELLHNNPEQHALWIMDVTHGERTVRRIPVV